MRLAVTIAREQNGKWVTLALPDSPIADQVAAFKKLKSDKKSASKYQSIMVLDSSDPVKRIKYSSLQEQEAILDLQKKMIAEDEKSKAKEAKAKESEVKEVKK